MVRLATLTALALVAACPRSGGQGSSFSSGASTMQAGSSSSGDVGSSTTSTSSTSSGSAEDSAAGSQGSGSGGVADLPQQPDFGPPQPEGCKGKIDFLFLISALGTMAGEQEQLLASFDGFMETIGTKFADFDTHIMSVNTDGTWRGDACEVPEWCGNKGNCGPNAMDYVCGSKVGNVWPCDQTLGAGLLFNAGSYATNKPCDLFGGNRYIIAGEPEPTEAFKCIASVGTSGDDPPLADSLVASVSDELNGPDGCNAGFLRDDALLVFVFIMDNDDEKSWLSPKKVYEAVVAAKGDDPASIVALAIIPQPQVGDPEPGCTYEPDGFQQHLREVVKMFPYNNHDGNTCAPNYAPFFDQAAGLVGEACSSFIPQ